MTTTNKWLLISKSRGDSNRCTPCRGNPDQHDTYVSHVSPCMPDVRFLRMVPVCGNLSWDADRFRQIPLLPRKRLPTQSTARQLTNPWVHTQLLSRASQWSRGRKTNFCWWPTTRFTGPISPTYDRYVQYLLTGANPLILNRHRRGYSLGGTGFPHSTPWPSQPAVSHFP
jgi:hypothetical protein